MINSFPNVRKNNFEVLFVRERKDGNQRMHSANIPECVSKICNVGL